MNHASRSISKSLPIISLQLISLKHVQVIIKNNKNKKNKIEIINNSYYQIKI